MPSQELIYGQVGPYEKTIYDEPVFAAIDRICEKYPDRPALIYLGKTWTYGEFKELIDRFAKALYTLGVSHGDRVMLYIPNSPQFLAGFLGSMKTSKELG